MINKNENQLVSLGDRESYYEKSDTTDLQKADKRIARESHSDDLSALLKNRAKKIRPFYLKKHVFQGRLKVS